MNSNRIWFGLCVLSGLIGFIIGKIVFIPGISVQHEINPVHLISVISPIFVAVVISIIFAKERDNIKEIKGLILQRSCSVLDICESVHQYILNRQIAFSTAVSLLKKLSINTKCIFATCKETKIQLSKSESDLINQIKNINNLMTNTPVGPEDESVQPVRVEENIIHYEKNRVSEIELDLDKLQSMVLSLQVDIIRK